MRKAAITEKIHRYKSERGIDFISVENKFMVTRIIKWHTSDDLHLLSRLD